MERITPEHLIGNPEITLILLTHIKSYELVLPEIKNKTVLDFGCGTGYGSNMLAQDAKQVVAVDIDEQVIEKARAKYSENNLEFKHINSTSNLIKLFPSNYFDVVTSFQVIEHISDVQSYLGYIKYVLKSKGKFFLTTPNAAGRLLPFQRPWNQFHIREYNYKSLSEILRNEFVDIEINGLTATEDLLKRENKRTMKNKWLLWPLTNIFIPEELRQKSLSAIKRILAKKELPKKSSTEIDTLDTKNIRIISKNINKCPNFYAVCYKP